MIVRFICPPVRGPVTVFLPEKRRSRPGSSPRPPAALRQVGISRRDVSATLPAAVLAVAGMVVSPVRSRAAGVA
jgi:hypothetical protein